MAFLLLLLISVLLIAIEAKIEAINGDKNHALSFGLSLVTFAIAAALLKQNVIFAFAGLYIPVRTWFDEVFNYFRGNKFYYIGEIALTDKLQKKLLGNRYLRYTLKLVFSVFMFVEFGLSKTLNIEDKPTLQILLFFAALILVLIAISKKLYDNNE